jgi:hypothetical protein
LAREIFPSCDLFNGRAIFAEDFELVPVIAAKVKGAIYKGNTPYNAYRAI